MTRVKPNWTRVLYILIVVTGCICSFVLISTGAWRVFGSQSIEAPSISLPDNAYQQKREAVLNSIESWQSGQLDLKQLCEIKAIFDGAISESISWNIYSNDPEQVVWTVECQSIANRISSEGKYEEQVKLLTMLYDISEERLYFDDFEVTKGLYQGGLTLDMNTSPPSLVVPYKSP